MPRYFFDVHDGVSMIDKAGVDLHDLESARIHAITTAGSVLRASAQRFWRGGEWHVVVRDDGGLILFTLTSVAAASPALESMLAPFPI